jgi:uncharacterized protein (TIGR02145 family)
MKYFKSLSLFLHVLLILLFASCDLTTTKNNPELLPPILTTTSISSITPTTAISGGIITSDGGSTITARGLCWSTSQYPTIDNYKTTDGVGIGSFSSSLTGLTESVSYYVRAYATNAVGTTYGTQVNFTTSNAPLIVVAGDNVSDYDGNVYHTLTIGSQTWMVENLKTTHYKDGTTIPNVTDGIAWNNLTTPSYCWYNNDISNKTTYGALYNWYAVNTGKLALTGWHVATNAEWTTLNSYISSHLGNSLNTAKALAATTNWATTSDAGGVGCNLNNNNSSGFSALPGGCRTFDNYSFFGYQGLFGYWWSSTVSNLISNGALSISMYTGNSSASVGSLSYMSRGFSVRCVRDSN